MRFAPWRPAPRRPPPNRPDVRTQLGRLLGRGEHRLRLVNSRDREQVNGLRLLSGDRLRLDLDRVLRRCRSLDLDADASGDLDRDLVGFLNRCLIGVLDRVLLLFLEGVLRQCLECLERFCDLLLDFLRHRRLDGVLDLLFSFLLLASLDRLLGFTVFLEGFLADGER